VNALGYRIGRRTAVAGIKVFERQTWSVQDTGNRL
jgi:hypothetical protein